MNMKGECSDAQCPISNVRCLMSSLQTKKKNVFLRPTSPKSPQNFLFNIRRVHNQKKNVFVEVRRAQNQKEMVLLTIGASKSKTFVADIGRGQT